MIASRMERSDWRGEGGWAQDSSNDDGPDTPFLAPFVDYVRNVLGCVFPTNPACADPTCTRTIPLRSKRPGHVVRVDGSNESVDMWVAGALWTEHVVEVGEGGCRCVQVAVLRVHTRRQLLVRLQGTFTLCVFFLRRPMGSPRLFGFGPCLSYLARHLPLTPAAGTTWAHVTTCTCTRQHYSPSRARRWRCVALFQRFAGGTPSAVDCAACGEQHAG